MIPGIMAAQMRAAGGGVDPNIGIVWSGRAAAEQNNWFGAAWSPTLSLFVSVAASGTNRVQTSPDGYTWTARPAPTAATPSTWRKVIWVDALGLFVAVADTGTARVMTSPDGEAWTIRSTSVIGFDVSWSPTLNRLVVIGYTAPFAWHSADGVTWTAGSGMTSRTWVGVCWSTEQSKYVAVGYGGALAISTDGQQWVVQPNTADVSLTRIVWVPELSLYVSVAQTPTTNLFTSPDCVVWTPRSAGIGGSLFDVTFGNGLIVAVSSEVAGSQRVTTSPDGVVWTPRNPSTASRMQGVVWAGSISRFVAVGQPVSGGPAVLTSL